MLNDNSNDIVDDNNLLDMRAALMAELASLGIDPATGRKVRSDKGQSHTKDRKTRSDKGKTHNISKQRADKGKTHNMSDYSRSDKNTQRSPLIAYRMLKNKLLSLPLPNENTPDYLRDYYVKIDYNGIFYPLEKYSHELIKPGGGRYMTGLSKSGAKLYRSSRWRAGKMTDLEEYRFNALQSIVSRRPVPPDPQNLVYLLFKKEFTVLKCSTTLELFCLLYHVDPNDVYDWDYEHWRHDYECLGGDVLSDEFTFNLTYSPGSPEFHPEYAESAKLLTLENENEEGDM